MLRVSKLADYATVVMVFLSRHPGQLYNSKDIAAELGLGQATVSKLLKLLTNSGLLDSRLGARGGYCLATSSNSISVADIITAIEGPSGLTECSHETGACVLEDVCGISDAWQLINQAIHKALDAVKLAELAAPRLREVKIPIEEIL